MELLEFQIPCGVCSGFLSSDRNIFRNTGINLTFPSENLADTVKGELHVWETAGFTVKIPVNNCTLKGNPLGVDNKTVYNNERAYFH